MKLNLLPNTMGLLWIKKGYLTFKSYPKVYLALFAACYILSIFALVGSIAWAAISILCSIAMMVATHDLLQGRLNPKSPVIMDVFSTLLRHRNTLILILLYSVIFFLTQSLVKFILSHLTPDFYTQANEYMAILKSSDITPSEILLEAYPRVIFMQSLLIVTPFLILFPFFCMTPALIFWTPLTPFKAIVFNFIATLRNKQTWFIFLICWACITIASILLIVIIFTLCSLLFGKAGIALGSLLALVGLLLFSAIGTSIMSAALYFAFQSSFIRSDNLAEA